MSVPEVTDLLQCLARWQSVNVQGSQVNGRGRKLFMGALIICAEAVHASMEMFQINFFVILDEEGKKAEREKKATYSLL